MHVPCWLWRLAPLLLLAACSSTPLPPPSSARVSKPHDVVTANWGPYPAGTRKTYARITPDRYETRSWQWIEVGVILGERWARCSASSCEQGYWRIRHNAARQRLEFVDAQGAVRKTAKLDHQGAALESGGTFSIGSTKVAYDPQWDTFTIDDATWWPAAPRELARLARDFSPAALATLPNGATFALARDDSDRARAKTLRSVTRSGDLPTLPTASAVPAAAVRALGPSTTQLHWSCSMWNAVTKTVYFSGIARVSGPAYLETKAQLEAAWSAHLARHAAGKAAGASQCASGPSAEALVAAQGEMRRYYLERQGARQVLDAGWEPAL